MRQLGWLVIAAACSHPPPPKAPPAEKPVKTIGDVAGHWVTSDDLDWYYALAVEPTGAIDLVVDRNKLGRCEQKGTVAAGTEPGTFQLTYAKNECNRDYNGAALQLKVASFTGDSLTLVISGYGSQESHTYKRDPKSAP